MILTRAVDFIPFCTVLSLLRVFAKLRKTTVSVVSPFSIELNLLYTTQLTVVFYNWLHRPCLAIMPMIAKQDRNMLLM